MTRSGGLAQDLDASGQSAAFDASLFNHFDAERSLANRDLLERPHYPPSRRDLAHRR
jgi:hypothetical protein